jgi:hypothetical protein
VAINTSGKCWAGSEAADIANFLKAYKAQGYEVHATRLCKCRCGSIAFELEADHDEGCAQRTCAACRTNISSATAATFGKTPSLRAGRAPNATARPVILQSASLSMSRTRGNSPTCAGSRSASAARTAGPWQASSIGKLGTVRHISFSMMLEGTEPCSNPKILVGSLELDGNQKDP